MDRKDIIRFYIPCSEAQRTKIEALRNERRLRAWRIKNGLGARTSCSDISTQDCGRRTT